MSLKVATVYRCVCFLSQSVANLPLQCQRRKNDIYTPDKESRLDYLLNVEPNSAQTAHDFWTLAIQNILLDGNAYIVPTYSAELMDISGFVLCGRGTVSHNTTLDTYTVRDPLAGINRVYREEEIIHLKNLTLDGKNGLSVLDFARLTLGIADAGDSETLDRFVNGGNVRGMVSNADSVRGFGEYQDSELEKTAKNLDTLFQTGNRIVSLPGQVDFKQLSLSSTDMQFLETRKFTVRELCRFFGIHPSFVFDDTSNNYKSAENANVAFLSHTLNPLLRNIEQEFTRKLVGIRGYGKRIFCYDRRGIFAADLESRAKYQAATIACGIFTVNEWRKEENKPPVEGGDKVLISANLKDINEATATAATTQTQKTNEDE